MSAGNLLNKALFLLVRGDLERGESVLREALAAAEGERDEVSPGTTLCVLGEYLLEHGEREEGSAFLRRLVAIPREDDVLGFEQRRARELLAERSG